MLEFKDFQKEFFAEENAEKVKNAPSLFEIEWKWWSEDNGEYRTIIPTLEDYEWELLVRWNPDDPEKVQYAEVYPKKNAGSDWKAQKDYSFGSDGSGEISEFEEDFQKIVDAEGPGEKHDKEVEKEVEEEMAGGGEGSPTNVTGANVSTDKPVVQTRKFANNTVFDVPGDKYHQCVKGKFRYHRYDKYVGNDDVGEAIRQFGRNNPGAGILVRDQDTGAMSYLKKPKNQGK